MRHQGNFRKRGWRRAYVREDLHRDPLAFFAATSKRVLNEAPVSVQRLSNPHLHSGDTYLLTYPGGKKLVAALLPPDQFRMILRTKGLLEKSGVPVVENIGRDKNVVFMRYIDGKTLDAPGVEQPRPEDLAHLLQSIHKIPVRFRKPKELLLKRRFRRIIERAVTLFRSKGLLSKTQSEALLTELRTGFPKKLTVVTAHMDFALRNIIRDVGGKLWLVDDESLRNYYCGEFVLARYLRHAENPAEFLKKFQDRELVESYTRNKRFWGMFFAVRNAYWRINENIDVAGGKERIRKLLGYIGDKNPSGF